MTVRMGLHIQHIEKPEVQQYVRQCKPGIATWVSTVHRDLMYEAKNWGCINVARRWFDGDDQWSRVFNDPVGAAYYCFNELYSMFAGVWNLLDYVTGFNEYWGSDKGEQWAMEAMYNYERTMHQLVKGSGQKYAAISCPSGNPEPVMWQWILNRAKQDGEVFPGDAYCAHAYWCTPAGPLDRQAGYDPVQPYLIGREFLLGPQCPVPIIYKEVGYDNYVGGDGKRGWMLDYQFANRDTIYANQFADWCNLMAQLADKHKVTVIGGTFFTVGLDEEWRWRKQFDFTGIGPIADRMVAWPKIHTVYAPVPEEPTGPYKYTLGFEEFATLHPEVGVAASPLTYDTWGNAKQLTSVGELCWWKAVNKITYIRHDVRQ